MSGYVAAFIRDKHNTRLSVTRSSKHRYSMESVGRLQGSPADSLRY